ncbi:hypothetical protein OH491_24855 [Termitidicoccus mucosus]|uniref:Uncharacterized protein n=1 Tax=Termitidicoccus mucosus TaxID=1184151 RepID=A0A178IQK9_9BACT|nr:hypothetical protein AW736_01675 [Opitutaceae bacterium TSB47]
MANYTGIARTNYFKVKDKAAFRSWAKKFDLEILKKSGKFALLPEEHSDTGGFDLRDPRTDEDFDICEEIARHLADDSIAVIMSAGHEKHRYIYGWAEAVNHMGERVQITLDEIYQAAKEKFGKLPSRAEY